MRTGDKVVVAIHEHAFGEDVRVFTTEAGAYKWKTEIAKDYWAEEFPDEPKPHDDEIGEAYFDEMHNTGSPEFFKVYQKMVRGE